MGFNIKMKVKDEWIEKWKRELRVLSSREGEEIQRCLVAQGFENLLFYKWMNLLGSGFLAIKIIENLKEKVK